MAHLGYLIEQFYEPVNWKLAESTVGVVGLGGGVTITEALCRAGVGSFVLIDYDVVEDKNVHRQAHERSGLPKVICAKDKIASINPIAKVVALQEKFSLQNETACAPLSKCDLVIFATDQFAAQAEGNRFILQRRIPAMWIGLAEEGMCGEIVWYHPEVHKNCMRCILEQRFLANEGGIRDPNSRGTNFADLLIVDGMASHIAIGLLTRSKYLNYFCTLIDELGSRQFLQVSLRQNFTINNSDPICRRLGIEKDNPIHFAYCTRFESCGLHAAPCPDCVEILGREFSPDEIAVQEVPHV